MRKLLVAAVAATLALGLSVPLTAGPAQAAKETNDLVLGMVLEPKGLDPTARAELAITQVTLYNLYEGLTKVNGDGSVSPLLAESWEVSPDLKTWTFKLVPDATFHDGTKLTAAVVKDAFTRYAAEDSTNKRKQDFTNMTSITTPDDGTVVIELENADPNLLFNLAQETAVITDAKSAATNATQPVGTGPFKFKEWVQGDSIVLEKDPAYRDAGDVALDRVTYKFIGDDAAIVNGLLAGDIDAFPIGVPVESLEQFENDDRFAVSVGTTEGDTILSINNKKAPLDDVRVRRAIAHAIDRQAIIDAVMSGYGTPIGSHFPPHNPAYTDLTGMYAYDPEKAKALLKEAGAEGTELTIKLPPPAYARQGGPVIAEMLNQAGFKTELENVEWAVWLDQVFKNKNFDLTIVSHAEPNDLAIYSRPDYYFQYDNPKFNEVLAEANSTLDEAKRTELLQQAQTILAEDAVNGFLFNLPKVGVAKKELTGLWKDAPIFANDLSAVRWE
ncbi:ABC transporter substrate-binding protein [Marinibaculum pumilum]|uniref:ABC transporter substrate-binding protein n=1 Tax=Marinibaculum pumilum TaxID=1766165 RepID=A0ABV7L1V7_9PROT